MKIRLMLTVMMLSLFFSEHVVAAESLVGSRPSTVLVMTDDQGMGDLSCMGNQVLQTPNIDRFYEMSTRLTDLQVSPTFAPMRAALISGCPPFKVGVTHTIMQCEHLAPDVFTMPQALAFEENLTQNSRPAGTTQNPKTLTTRVNQS